MMTKLNIFSQKYVKVKGEDRQEISTIKIMVREIIQMDIGQIVERGEYFSVVEYNMDRIIETDQCTIRTVRVMLEEEILEGIFDQIIIEVKIMQVDLEEIIEMIIMKELEFNRSFNRRTSKLYL